MSDFVLHEPTPEQLGLRLRTNNGVADIQAKSLTTTWRRLDRRKLTGMAGYTYDVIMEAYIAGYQDGMRRPIKERVLLKQGIVPE